MSRWEDFYTKNSIAIKSHTLPPCQSLAVKVKMLKARTSQAMFGPTWPLLLEAPGPPRCIWLFATTGQQSWLFMPSHVPDWCAPSVSNCTPLDLSQKHAQRCDDALPPPEAITRKWKDTARLFAAWEGPQEHFFGAREKIWAVSKINSWHTLFTLVGLREERK